MLPRVEITVIFLIKDVIEERERERERESWIQSLSFLHSVRYIHYLFTGVLTVKITKRLCVNRILPLLSCETQH